MNRPLPYNGQNEVNGCLYAPKKDFSLMPSVGSLKQVQCRNNAQRQSCKDPNHIVRNGNERIRKPQ